MAAPWLTPPDFLGAMVAGTQGGLARRRAADEEAQSSQRLGLAQQEEDNRQADAASRLKLSYDSLAQQHDLTQAEIVARARQAEAAQALRHQANDSLMQWRQQQIQNQQARLADAEAKQTTVEALKTKLNEDVTGFYADVPKVGVSNALKKHPLAATEPGIRSAAAQALINPKSDKTVNPGNAELTVPGDSGEKLTRIPLNSPLVNKFGSSALSAVAGTNLVTSTPKTFKTIHDVKDALDNREISPEDAVKIVNERFKQDLPDAPEN